MKNLRLWISTLLTRLFKPFLVISRFFYSWWEFRVTVFNVLRLSALQTLQSHWAHSIKLRIDCKSVYFLFQFWKLIWFQFCFLQDDPWPLLYGLLYLRRSGNVRFVCSRDHWAYGKSEKIRRQLHIRLWAEAPHCLWPYHSWISVLLSKRFSSQR